MRPTVRITWKISRARMPLMIASTSDAAAPTPAPSVGVKKPSHMPPSTPTMRAITNSVLTRASRSLASSPVSGGGAAAGGASAAAPAECATLRASPTRSGCVMATNRM